MNDELRFENKKALRNRRGKRRWPSLEEKTAHHRHNVVPASPLVLMGERSNGKPYVLYLQYVKRTVEAYSEKLR